MYQGCLEFNHFFSAEREKNGKKYITKASYLEATSVINTKGKKIVLFYFPYLYILISSHSRSNVDNCHIQTNEISQFWLSAGLKVKVLS